MISMERRLELNEICGEEIRNLLQSGLDLSNMFDDDNAKNPQEIARSHGILLHEFYPYIIWMVYVNGVLNSCDSPGELDKLEEYLKDQIRLRKQELNAAAEA